jgi:hypothetical protein
MISPAGTIAKRAGEKYPLELRYRAPDIPTGVAITVVTVSVAPTGLTLGSGQFSGTLVWAWVEGGTAGIDYIVTFVTTLDNTAKLIDDWLVKVR